MHGGSAGRDMRHIGRGRRPARARQRRAYHIAGAHVVKCSPLRASAPSSTGAHAASPTHEKRLRPAFHHSANARTSYGAPRAATARRSSGIAAR